MFSGVDDPSGGFYRWVSGTSNYKHYAATTEARLPFGVNSVPFTADAELLAVASRKRVRVFCREDDGCAS